MSPLQAAAGATFLLAAVLSLAVVVARRDWLLLLWILLAACWCVMFTAERLGGSP